MADFKDLVEKFCPNGVVYKALYEVSFYATERIDASTVNADTYIGVDNLLPDRKGKVSATYVPEKGRLIKFLANDILIGNIRPYLKKIWLADHDGGTNGDVLVVRLRQHPPIMPEFLYYVLSSDKFFEYDMRYSKGTKMPRGDKDAILKYIIPVPPLEVQQEIVRILDQFTQITAELNAELDAELNARKHQYEYYLNQILEFEDIPIWVELGTVTKSVTTGLNPRRFFKLNTDDASNYYVTIRELQNNSVVFSEKTDRINDEALRLCNNRSNLEIGDILFSGTGTIGETAVIEKTPTNWNIKEGVYSIKPLTEKLNSRFLMHLLHTNKIRSEIFKKVAGGTVKSIPMGELRKLKIPVPPMSEQERLVNLIDRFDALFNDLTSGLSAEIAARQKQYAYYRDNLLSFQKIQG